MVCTFWGKVVVVVVVVVAFIRQFWPQNAKPRKGIEKSNDWAAIAVVFSPLGRKVKPGLSETIWCNERGRGIQVKIMENQFQNAMVIYLGKETVERKLWK